MHPVDNFVVSNVLNRKLFCFCVLGRVVRPMDVKFSRRRRKSNDFLRTMCGRETENLKNILTSNAIEQHKKSNWTKRFNEKKTKILPTTGGYNEKLVIQFIQQCQQNDSNFELQKWFAIQRFSTTKRTVPNSSSLE